MKKIIARRLSEPSTWAGLAALLPAVATLASQASNPHAWAAVIGGAAAVLLPERRTPAPLPPYVSRG